MSTNQTFIERLRAKPEPVRKRIAAVLTICLTIFIVTLWGISFRESLTTLSLSAEVQQESVAKVPTTGNSQGHLRRIALGAKTLFGDIMALGSATAGMLR